MAQQEFQKRLAPLLAREKKYKLESYIFISEAVNYAVTSLKERRHVSASELLTSLRDYAFREYGVISSQVLKDLGIDDAADVGKLVYLMIEVGLLSSSPEDSPDDFKINFKFYEENAANQGKLSGFPKIDS